MQYIAKRCRQSSWPALLTRNVGLKGYSASSSVEPLHFCVVGSGPAGFYTVSQLIKVFKDRARITVLDRLPTPFGLVRSGVAPDHPETKNVINQFTELGKDPRVSFLGNVRVGQDAPLSLLRSLFNGVILAYGAESNRLLNIPGRHLEGIFTAREFVWWYNGHPEHAALPIDLAQVRRVAILGLGNVALDCARVLLQPPERLATTDIADHAMAQLRQSKVEEVTLLGRRGPAQAAFTAKELREILTMEGIRVHVDPNNFQLTDLDQQELKKSRARKRVFDLLSSTTSPAPSGVEKGKKLLRLQFFRSPAGALANDVGQIQGLKLEKTRLVEQNGRQSAVNTGEFETTDVDMMLESIGYRSIAMPGAPFDDSTGVIPNKSGRVIGSTSADAEVSPGLYVSGWVKRGPSGIIGTNLMDATETVNMIAEDAYNGQLERSSNEDPVAGLQAELKQAGVKAVTFNDWSQKLDAYEVQQGKVKGKPRSKVTDVSQMLEICSA